MEKLPVRILVSTVDAEPIGVLFSVSEKERQGIITLDSHNKTIQRTFSEAVSLLHFPSPPLAGVAAGIQLTENKPTVPRGFLAACSTYYKQKKRH